MNPFVIRHKKAVFHTAFFLCAIIFLGGCSKTPDEKQIQLIINDMVTAAENNSPAGLTEHLHENFQANGQMDAKQVQQMLVMYGMQHTRIAINVISSQIQVDPIYTDKASATLSVMVTGSSGRGLPEDGRVRVVKLQWIKDNNWKLLRADWEM